MPIAQLYIIEGRSDEQKETLIREVTEAIHNSPHHQWSDTGYGFDTQTTKLYLSNTGTSMYVESFTALDTVLTEVIKQIH